MLILKKGYCISKQEAEPKLWKASVGPWRGAVQSLVLYYRAGTPGGWRPAGARAPPRDSS